MYRRSLKTRITIAFCLFGLVLGLAFSVIVLEGFDLAQEWTIRHHLERKLAVLQAQQDEESALAQLRFHFHTSIGEAALPAALRERVAGLPVGVHVLTRQPGPGEDYLAIAWLPERRQRLYLIFDASDLLASHDEMHTYLYAICLTGTLLVVGLGALLGQMTARPIIAPLVRLSEQVARISPDRPLPRIDAPFSADEVGVLARTLDSLLLRITAFVTRERHFTRNVSHELRTPVTVLKGALELIGAQPAAETAALQRPLARSRRALAEMEQVIDAFLWMAREQPGASARCELVAAVEQAVAQQQELAARKQLSVQISASAAPVLAAPPAVVVIAVSNLLRNALQYSERGAVQITVAASAVTVSDSGRGIAAADLPHITAAYQRSSDSQGYGLGLAIVEEFCERFGWRLHIASQEGVGTQATLHFDENFTSPPLSSPSS